MAPVEEVRLCLLARRQIALLPIELSQINVRVLVPAFVVWVKEARVVRERGDDVSAFLRRIRQLLRLTARYWNGINIEYSALIAVKQDRLFVIRKRRSANARRRHELLDRVLFDRLSGSFVPFWRRSS